MKTGIPLLLEMLTYPRPAFSEADELFCARYIEPTGARADAFGNYILRIGPRDIRDGPARVAWCAHTDTVHRASGRQRLRISNGIVRVANPLRSNCLGADDTTGVWLLLEMIRADVPGLYIFHRAEERGCLGSNWIEQNAPELLGGIDYAIAFDRAGYDSVITHQMGARTASDAFAWSIAAQLPPGMAPDDGGVYTDTEVYAHIIPECTNLSVGYARQHSANETQDLDFARQLRDALLRLDVDALACERTPELPVPWWDSMVEEDGEDWAETCAMCGQDTSTAYLFASDAVCRACFDYLCDYEPTQKGGAE